MLSQRGLLRDMETLIATLKNVRLSGMQAQAEKIKVDTINTEIKSLKENKEVYKSVHGVRA